MVEIPKAHVPPSASTAARIEEPIALDSTTVAVAVAADCCHCDCPMP